MATTRWAEELRFARESATAAGQILLDSYERLERIDYKSKRDVVTNADYASERAVLAAIRDAFPGDAILAEESGAHAAGPSRRSRDGRTTQADRQWVIDPLDGTVNYANGIPYYCVSIGLVAEGRPVVGVVLDPARGECYDAVADGPARLNEIPVTASDKDTLSDYVVSLAVIGKGGLSRERRIAPRIRIHRRMGSAALALAYVANGRFDAFIQNGGLSAWDVVAAGLIAERSGAVVTDVVGGPWWNPRIRGARHSVVASPAVQHGPLMELLAAVKMQAVTRHDAPVDPATSRAAG
jgi:myo-inositol-1(or 4)-monophosphatase